MDKCIIFGASSTGRVAKEMLETKYDVIGFADNSEKKWGEVFSDKEILNPQELTNYKNIEIIIASVYYSQIYTQLKNMGLNNIKVFYYLGNATFGDGKEYILYEIENNNLFTKCIYDEEEIKKIVDNYSYNYDDCNIKIKQNIGNKNKISHRKILICAYIFPPLGGAGVQRTVKFVKYLRNFGYEPVVLTVGKNDGKVCYDYSLIDEIEDDIQIITIDNDIYIPEALSIAAQQEVYNLYCGIMENKNWIDEFINVVSKTDSRLVPDEKVIWVNECLKKIDELMDFDNIDLIYTSASPFSSFILGFYLKKRYNIPWVMDYRDAWVGSDYYVEHYYSGQSASIELQRKLEEKLLYASDGIIMAAGNFIDQYKQKYKLQNKKMIEITNGYDEEDFKDIVGDFEKNKKFTLCYNGSVYGDRSPVVVLEAINTLIENGKIDSKKIQWIFNGSIDRFWKQKLQESDKYNIIIENGYLPHAKSIKNAMSSDLLILLGLYDGGSKFGYTGKLFEYLRMGKFILGLSSKDGVYDCLFQKMRCGKNCEYDDKDGIKDIIFERYNKWEKSESDLKLDIVWDEVNKYSRYNLTKKLVHFFNDLLVN